ncbi:TPA: hypothetical protein HA265_01850 [Candidatus Woesearchaeota archaeon]|nr:hypothetical protein [Candidatus Woesearchaeota archaeon]
MVELEELLGRSKDKHFSLTTEDFRLLHDITTRVRQDVILMTTLAQSGHPGGPLSAADHYVVGMFELLRHGLDRESPFAKGSPKFFHDAAHYSAGWYSTMAAFGFFPEDDLWHFRQAGSPLEGHITFAVPHIPRHGGLLGQGVSDAVGWAHADRLFLGKNATLPPYLVFSGDGGTAKGQFMEALRAMNHHRFTNIIPVIDENNYQITGTTDSRMHVDKQSLFQHASIRPVNVEGHDLHEIFQEYEFAINNSPNALRMRTTMGQGVSFMENTSAYHGAPLPFESADGKDALHALVELGMSEDEARDSFAHAQEERKKAPPKYHPMPRIKMMVRPAPFTLYTKPTACRKAWKSALEALADANMTPDGKARPDGCMIAAIDCDLAGSVGLTGFRDRYPDNYIENGITEHHTATMAGSMSIAGLTQEPGVLVFWPDFGVLTLSEVYGQQRMNSLNRSNLKIVSTHCGLDVGEDGASHQEINYLLTLPDIQTFVPADANQVQHIVNYMAQNHGTHHMAMGRSTMPVITRQGSDEPFFDESYQWRPGKVDVLREYGSEFVIFSYGNLIGKAVSAADELHKEGIDCTVVNCSTPLEPADGIFHTAVDGNTRFVMTYEDHYVGNFGGSFTGMAPVVTSRLYRTRNQPLVLNMGVRNFSHSGKPDDLYRMSVLDKESLISTIRAHHKR